MLHVGFDFQTVRVLCTHCGWFRNIAHSGCSDGKRALVAVRRSKDPSHVLQAKVIEVAESIPLDEALEAHPGFRDLDAESHQKGLHPMLEEFDPLVADQACPRCTQTGKLRLDQIHMMGRHVRY